MVVCISIYEFRFGFWAFRYFASFVGWGMGMGEGSKQNFWGIGRGSEEGKRVRGKGYRSTQHLPGLIEIKRNSQFAKWNLPKIHTSVSSKGD